MDTFKEISLLRKRVEELEAIVLAKVNVVNKKEVKPTPSPSASASAKRVNAPQPTPSAT